MTKAREIAELGQKLTVDGSGNLDITSGDLTLEGGRIYVNESDNGNIAAAITRDADEGYLDLYRDGAVTVSLRGNGTSIFNGGSVVFGGVSDGAAGTVTLQNDGDIRGVLTSGAGGDTLISAISGVSNGYQILVDSSNNQTYKWHNGGTASMTLDSSGNLGLGTNAPASTFHIDRDNASGATYGIVQNDGTANTNTIAGWVIRDGTTITSGIRRRRDGAASPIEIGSFSDESVQFVQNNVSRIKFNNNDDSVVVNEGGVDADFRVESDNVSGMFFVDASADQVVITGGGSITAPSNYRFMSYADGTAGRSVFMHAAGDGGVVISGSSGGSQAALILGNNWGTTGLSFSEEWRILMDGSNDSLKFKFGGSSTALNLSSAGELATYYSSTFNENGGGYDFRVESDSYTHALFVDAGNNTIGINNSSPDALLHVGETNPQSDAKVVVRNNGNCLEWGHGNTQYGYYGILGTNKNNGHAFIGFGANANSGTSNTYDTDGHQGTVLRQNISGIFIIEQSTNADQDNQNFKERVRLGSSEVAFNDESTDTDFRIESNNEAHMFYVDAGNDTVSINNTQTSYHLGVGANYVSNEGLFGVQRALGYSRHAFGGSASGATKTVTIVLGDYGLNAVELNVYVTGHKYNSGPNNFAVKLVHVAMEESGTMRINSDQTSALGYRIGNQQAQVGSITASSTGGGNLTFTFTVGGEYDCRILVEAKGPAVNYISSITHS